MAKKSPNSKHSLHPKVLIADDDEIFAKSLRELFHESGFDVSVTRNMDATVDMLREKVFDVIILDMRMPIKTNATVGSDTGVLIARMLQRFSSPSQEAPVIVFTAYPSVGDCVAAIDAGAYYLPKTITGRNMSEELVDECKKLAKKEQQQELKTKDPWIVKCYDELVKRFGGKTVALIERDFAERIGLKDGTAIDDRVVITARTRKELEKRIIANPQLLRAMPTIFEVLEEPEII